MSIKEKIGRVIRRKRSNQSRVSPAISTQVVHCKRDKFDVYIGRPGKWGNPFMIGRDGSRKTVIDKYITWIFNDEQRELRNEARKELRGKRLGCFCSPYPCHGDVLASIAESIEIE